MGEQEEQIDVLELVDGGHHQGRHEVGLQVKQSNATKKLVKEKNDDITIIEDVRTVSKKRKSGPKQNHLVRQPGDTEEENNDDEHLDHPLLIGKHRPIPHSVHLARCPVECHKDTLSC